MLIGGEIVLEAKAENLALVESPRLRLNGGRHQLELRYLSSPVGTGRIRLFWRKRYFARESTPPKSWNHPPRGTHYKSLLKSTKLRKGCFLATVSGCLGCHVPDKALESETAAGSICKRPIFAWGGIAPERTIDGKAAGSPCQQPIGSNAEVGFFAGGKCPPRGIPRQLKRRSCRTQSLTRRFEGR